MRRRFAILYNPDAGQRKRAFVDRCVRALEARGAKVAVSHCATPAHGRAAALDTLNGGGTDAVVAAGGDGTVANVARGMLGTAMPLGIIPAGTANVLAREIGLARRADDVARCLMEGPVADVHGGFANDLYFVLMAGAGIDGGIVQGVDEAMKRKWGKLAFACSAARVLMRPTHTEFDIVAGNHRMRAPWAVVTNARLYAGSFTLARQASVLEPGLHLVTIEGGSLPAVAANMAALALGLLERMPGVTVMPCNEVTLGADAAVPLQLDGDSHAMTPVTVRPNDTPFRLIVPQAE